ncbi:MAG: amino acid ABC transporter permease [Polaromonas sp.]
MANWRWDVFCQNTIDNELVAGCFASGRDQTYLQWMLQAWGWTVSVSLSALALALVVGSVIGTVRTLPNSPWLVRFGNAWVELFRNIPLLVQIFLWYFVLPKLIPPMKSFPPFILVVCALGFFTSSRIAEQLRSGLQALPRGQRYAGMALGLTTAQYYRYVLLPMAYRIIMPPLTSESMNIFKNSAVAFAVSIPELTQFYLQAGEETSAQIEIYIGVVVLYVISAMTINRIMTFIERKIRVPGLVAATGSGGH